MAMISVILAFGHVVFVRGERKKLAERDHIYWKLIVAWIMRFSRLAMFREIFLQSSGKVKDAFSTVVLHFFL